MSTTIWIQILGIIFGMTMLYFTFVKRKRQELSIEEMWLWFSGWGILILLALWPSILDPIIGPLNFHRRLDFFVVVGFFVLLGLVFYNYSVVKKMERKLEVYVRQEALKTAQEVKKEK